MGNPMSTLNTCQRSGALSVGFEVERALVKIAEVCLCGDDCRHARNTEEMLPISTFWMLKSQHYKYTYSKPNNLPPTTATAAIA